MLSEVEVSSSAGDSKDQAGIQDSTEPISTEQVDVAVQKEVKKKAESPKEKPHVFSSAKLTAKHTKGPGVTNWRLKSTKAEPNVLWLSWWEAGMTGPGTTVGCGVKSGVKSGIASSFGEKKVRVKATVYVFNKKKNIDSWIIEDIDGNFHRLGWANAYQSNKYPCYKSRAEVSALISKANIPSFPDQV